MTEVPGLNRRPVTRWAVSEKSERQELFKWIFNRVAKGPSGWLNGMLGSEFILSENTKIHSLHTIKAIFISACSTRNDFFHHV